MKTLARAWTLFGFLWFPLAVQHAVADEIIYDVVVYGGTSSAITTAVQTKKMGKTVVVVSPDKHLGGLTSGGLGWTDSGKKDAIGGLSREFYHRVWKHYQDADAWTFEDQAKFGNRNQSPPSKEGDGATMWVFEPHVAERIFDDWINEHDIPLHRSTRLDRSPGGVTVRKGRIESFRTQDGQVFRGRMFVDATYEGDLMAAAGVNYHVGREANSVYDEKYNGVQTGVLHHQHFFAKPVDPYVTPGDPSSGLLPLISPDPPGEFGEGDHRVQAYCFRMCLTNVDENRIPFPKPDAYDPKTYELLGRVFDTGWRGQFRKFDPMPNHKTDTNNHGPVSTDYLGANYDYPEASYDRRAEIIAAHEAYQKGLVYFVANDKRVPAEVREAFSKWGLAKDEFTDNGGWPHQIYVREARRMIGEYVMTEHDCLDKVETPDSVGMGSYTLDSHNVQRYVKPDGFVQNEGDIGVKTPRPYRIAFGSIVPKKSQCENLLVPVCVSSSHMAFGSIRMEPVFMVLGQSAATAACLAIDGDKAVQDLAYPVLRDRLIADGQRLQWDEPYPIDASKLAGIVIDDLGAVREGTWFGSEANKPFVNGGYHHNGDQPAAETYAVFETDELTAGRYEVLVSYSPNKNRADQVPVTIRHAGGEAKKMINQKLEPTRGSFTSVGQYLFESTGSVRIDTVQTNGHVIIDAVQFLPVQEANQIQQSTMRLR